MESQTTPTPTTTTTGHKKRTEKSEVPVGAGMMKKTKTGEQPGGATTEDTFTPTTDGATTTTPITEEKKTTMPADLRLNASEMTALHMALCIESQCYVKNHMLMLLSGDRTGMIRFWHDNVTKPNLDRLILLANACGLSMPWSKPLETREMELKSMLGTVTGALTDIEALAEIKLAAKSLGANYMCGFESAGTEDCRNLFAMCNRSVLDNFPKLCDTMKMCDGFFPLPKCERVLTVDSGVHTRK